MSALKFATAPVNWNNNDIPGFRTPEPFPALLDRMVEAGYTATEYDDKIGPEPDIVGTAAEVRYLELCGFYQWVDLQDYEQFRASLPTLQERLRHLGELGCRHLIVADRLRPERDAIAGRVPADGSASLDTEGYERVAELGNELAQCAAAFGFRTHYHNHVGTYIESPDEVAALAEALHGGALDFCFDTGHFAYAGGDALDFITAYGDAIGHLHLKDVDGDVLQQAHAAGWSFREELWKIVFAPLGHGTARISDIIAILQQTAFAGWIVIEQDTCVGDPTEVARRNLAFARAAASTTETP